MLESDINIIGSQDVKTILKPIPQLCDDRILVEVRISIFDPWHGFCNP